MTGKKPSDTNKPIRKRTKIDMEMKLNIINKYEKGQSLTYISRELNLPTSTVGTIVRDSERIKEHMKSCGPLKCTIISKRRTGIIYDMEKLLIVWMEEQMQRHVPLSLQAIQSKARSLYATLKEERQDTSQPFVASNGWFSRFKSRVGFNVKVENELNESNDSNVQLFPDVFKFLELQVIETGDAADAPQFRAKEMSAAFSEIASGLARLQKMDSDTKRFTQVQKSIDDVLAVYRKIYVDVGAAQTSGSSEDSMSG